MRILQVTSARAFGGGERHLADLTRGLVRGGHEVGVVVRASSGIRARLAAIHPVQLFELELRGALDIPNALKLARLARERQVDIIHAHVARDYTVAALAARLAPAARLVITRHVLFPMSRLHRPALSNVSRVIAVSEAVGRALRAQRIFDPEKIRTVTNGTDVHRFAAAGAGRPLRQGPGRVGIVGELSEVKDQETFVRAAALLVRDSAASPEFLIVGADNSPSGRYHARLRKLIAELGLSSSARMLGPLNDDEMPGILSSFDLLVSASRSESFGIAMAEAMAAGVPVVATATEGALEIVEDGVTGLITPIGDPTALAAAIASLLRDEDRRLALGARAAARARERFSLERMVEETVRVYREALE
jgi:glycosyltransferase involved in cell wall biosynthesis